MFRNFRIVYGTGIDFLDPGLAYTADAWQILWNVYEPLLGYKHAAGAEGADLVPALAKDLPEISSDGRTYRLTLRKGLRYSNGSPVKASDFAATIERLFKLDYRGHEFFTNIVGARQFARTKHGRISGIATDDETGEITIRLVEPEGDFSNVLAMEFAALVPASTPAEDRSTHPIPSTGPYMIESYSPNKRFVLRRNPHFEPTETVPDGNADKMTGVVVEDGSAALRQVIGNKADYSNHTIPGDQVADIRKQYGDRLEVYTPANTFYFFMNTRLAPFDRLAVRKAVNYAIDRTTLVRLYGGLAQPTQNVLPPAYPQYQRLDLYAHDVSKAKRLVRQAGATGAAVTVWGSEDAQSRKAVSYLARVLRSIGLDAKPKIVSAVVYWTTIGNRATKAQIGFADWFQDYPHPLDWFDVLLNGDRITATRNRNYSNADVREINEKIDELRARPELDDEVNAQWAEVDRMVMEKALWAPYVNRSFTDFLGQDVDTRCYVNHVLYQFDLSQICKK